MSKLRFKVGDLARVLYVRETISRFWVPGAVVKIVRVGPFPPAAITSDGYYNPDASDYEVDCGHPFGELACPMDDQLAPYPDPPGSWDDVAEFTGFDPRRSVPSEKELADVKTVTVSGLKHCNFNGTYVLRHGDEM